MQNNQTNQTVKPYEKIDFFNQILNKADLLLNESQISQIMDKLAQQISSEFQQKLPLVLVVMKGGYFVASELLRRLNFPLEVDYLEATRYGKNTSGACLNWLHKSATQIQARDIILVDDVFDEGITLAEINTYLQDAGANSVKSLVLVEKQVANRKIDFRPDYIGALLPNRFLFGCGMDLAGIWRNLPQIYAINDEDIDKF